RPTKPSPNSALPRRARDIGSGTVVANETLVSILGAPSRRIDQHATGELEEVTCASHWCPARSTGRPRRRARNPFAYTRFGEGRRRRTVAMWGTKSEDKMSLNDRRRG